MKMVIFETEPWEKKAFQEVEKEQPMEFVEGPLTADNAGEYADASIISTFIYSELTEKVLKQFNKLELIATRSTGYDHIDLGYCRKHRIAIANVPAYGDHTVAEHVFGLLLTISHRLTEAIDRTRRGDFSLKGLRGFDLQDKVLGVVGTGSIGRCVIRIAGGFGMKVLAFDVHPDEKAAQRMNFEYVEMNRLLSASDVITLHVPATKATHHLLSHDEFGKMKKGVVLINTARGEVVDVHALMHALADGKVRAVGLDVLPEEPTIREEAELLRTVFHKQHDLETLLADHLLLRLRNVYITPHSAFNTCEAVQRILDTTAENIAAFLRGEPQNLVNQED
jgi:D-lactate dehydrogenase